VGMMEGAFFVSRTELLEWVNGLLAVKLPKVEDCATGAIYCQIVDACFPGTVKMSKVNWMARSDHEFIPNFKLLQAAFDRNNIEKHIAVDQLIRAKYQDNLEFFQWMKALWDSAGSGVQGYDPVKAREGRPVPAWAKLGAGPGGLVGRGTAPAALQENHSLNREQAGGAQKADPPTRRRPTTPGSTGAAKVAPQRSAAPRSAPASAVARPASALARPGVRAAARPVASQTEEDLRAKLQQALEENAELQKTSAGLEDERDYYWRKLRSVEIVCSTLEAQMDPTLNVAGIISQIQGILYAEKDEEEPEDKLEENSELANQPHMEEPSSAQLETAAELGVDQCVEVA